MPAIDALWIVPISFAAFVLKSVAAFGPGVILVPLGALFVGAKEIVVVIGLLDLISNAALLPATRIKQHRTLFPISLYMLAGSAAGAALLVYLSQYYVSVVLGTLLVPLGIGFMLARTKSREELLQDRLPKKITTADRTMSLIAGGMGGLAGITGPVLAWHLGRKYQKEIFRQIMIPALFASALVRTTVYIGGGLVTYEITTLVLLAVPGLIFGLWIGNHIFKRLSQPWFSRIVGLLIALSGIRLLAR